MFRTRIYEFHEETRSSRARAHAAACRASARTLVTVLLKVTRGIFWRSTGLPSLHAQESVRLCSFVTGLRLVTSASLSSRSIYDDHTSIDDDDATCAILRSPSFRRFDRPLIARRSSRRSSPPTGTDALPLRVIVATHITPKYLARGYSLARNIALTLMPSSAPALRNPRRDTSARGSRHNRER